MPTIPCQRCGAQVPPDSIVHYGDGAGGYRPWCLACVNHDVAQRIGLEGFEQVDFAPVQVADVRGQQHTFHFRLRLFGNLVLDAFELIGGEPGGYRFQVIDDADADPWALLARLIERIRRALALTHLSEDRLGLGIQDRFVRGRIDSDASAEHDLPVLIIDGREIAWEEFGHMLMAFAGWQFKLECFDRSEER